MCADSMLPYPLPHPMHVLCSRLSFDQPFRSHELLLFEGWSECFTFRAQVDRWSFCSIYFVVRRVFVW